MINWINKNRLLTVLIVVVVYFAYKSYSPVAVVQNISNTRDKAVSLGAPEFEPVSDNQDRIVIQNSNLSLLVSDVRDSGEKIVDFAKQSGGFMVSASYNRPDESAFATINVRVPSKDLDRALDTFRGLSVKVTSENLQGTDVTERYVDIGARLETLNLTKSKFEQILVNATEVQDLLQVQRELISLQTQIDNLVGQRDALEKNAELTKITVYLSTDELSLPYAPDEKFRPRLDFKLATRSVLGSLQSLGKAVIWIAVYSVLWIPAILIFIGFKRYNKKRDKLVN